MSFIAHLKSAAGINASWLMVGLDPNRSRMPLGIAPDADGVLDFNQRVIEATQDLVMGYKLNFAFYEVLGPRGWDLLARTREAIPRGLIALADAKRGDIGDTAEMYAQSIFDELDFDAVTVAPYVGFEGIRPFLEREHKGSFVLCRTSNRDPLPQSVETPQGPLYELIARVAPQWGDNVGLVVGSTDLEALSRVRVLAPRTPFLVPGVGAQGGSLQETVSRAMDGEGGNAVIAISRAILYASDGADFALAARRQTERFLYLMREGIARLNDPARNAGLGRIATEG